MSLDDRSVRARTRAGRLTIIDQWLALHEAALLHPNATVVDFGFGETPVTTLEWAATLVPTITVIAIERDTARVDAARASPRLRALHGGFEALAALAPVTVVRAMNVLRAYPLEDIAAAHAALGAPLIDGGLVIEGSSDPEGHVTVAHVLRKRGGALHREAMLFHTTFARGFGPWLFRDYLPRDLRRSVKPGTPLFDFFTTWHAAFEQTSGSPTERFEASISALPGASSWAHGTLRWQTPYTPMA